MSGGTFAATNEATRQHECGCVPAVRVMADHSTEDGSTEVAAKLDSEWVLLISLAKELGLSKDEIRQFLHSTKQTLRNNEKAV